MNERFQPTTQVNTQRYRVTALVAALLGAIGSSAMATTPAPPTNGCSTTTTVPSTDPALPAATTDGNTTTSTITVAGLDTVIWDVDLTTFITHTFNFDIGITLTSPAGTVVTITTDNGGNADVFNGTVWDDDGGDTNPPGPATDNAFADNVVETPLVPEEALGAFIGEDPNGVWTLDVFDGFAGQQGSLAAWSLIITTVPAAPDETTSTVVSDDPTLPAAITDNNTTTSTLTVTGLDPFLCDLDLTTFITHTFNGDLDITLTSPAGTVVTITTDNGVSNDDLFNGTLWDDDAGDTNPPGPVTDSAFANATVETPLVPEEALAAFIGEDPNGTWILRVFDDNFNGNQGQLLIWFLDVTTCLLPDGDGDGVADVCDPCPADNPDDANGNGTPDCQEPPPPPPPPPPPQPTPDSCGCDGGTGGMMVMPMTLLGMGWLRRTARRRRRRADQRERPEWI